MFHILCELQQQQCRGCLAALQLTAVRSHVTKERHDCLRLAVVNRLTQNLICNSSHVVRSCLVFPKSMGSLVVLLSCSFGFCLRPLHMCRQ
jgi:hypothetical protein